MNCCRIHGHEHQYSDPTAVNPFHRLNERVALPADSADWQGGGVGGQETESLPSYRHHSRQQDGYFRGRNM